MKEEGRGAQSSAESAGSAAGLERGPQRKFGLSPYLRCGLVPDRI